MPGLLITDYATLQDAVADWLLRSDLTDRIPTFIQSAESSLRRDIRIRRLHNEVFPVSSAEETFPPDLLQLVSLSHNGPTFFGDIDIVPSGSLSELVSQYGSTGPPRAAARIDTNRFRFSPVPDTRYDLELVYWQTVPRLSDTVTSNWLLEEHPDIYLYGTLMETAPYLRDDARVNVWATMLNTRLAGLDRATDRQQYSGSLVRQPTLRIP